MSLLNVYFGKEPDEDLLFVNERLTELSKSFLGFLLKQPHVTERIHPNLKGRYVYSDKYIYKSFMCRGILALIQDFKLDLFVAATKKVPFQLKSFIFNRLSTSNVSSVLG